MNHPARQRRLQTMRGGLRASSPLYQKRTNKAALWRPQQGAQPQGSLSPAQGGVRDDVTRDPAQAALQAQVARKTQTGGGARPRVPGETEAGHASPPHPGCHVTTDIDDHYDVDLIT